MATSGAGFQVSALPSYTPVLKPMAYTGIGGALETGINSFKSAATTTNDIFDQFRLEPKRQNLEAINLDEEIDITPKKFEVARKKLDLEGLETDTDIQLEPMRKTFKAQTYDTQTLQSKQEADAIRAVPGLETAIRRKKEDESKYMWRDVEVEQPDGSKAQLKQKYDLDGRPVGVPTLVSQTDKLADELIKIDRRAAAQTAGQLRVLQAKGLNANGEPIAVGADIGGGWIMGPNNKPLKRTDADTAATLAKRKTEVVAGKSADLTLGDQLQTIAKLGSKEMADAREAVTGDWQVGNQLRQSRWWMSAAGRNYINTVKSLDAQNFLASIAAMKGMGSLSDAEGKKVSDAFAVISDPTAYSEKDWVDQLDYLRNKITEIRTRHRRNLRDKLVESGKSWEEAKAEVGADDEAFSLPAEGADPQFRASATAAPSKDPTKVGAAAILSAE